MAGRKRKPDHLKVVAGTDQPCRMNPDAPEAPKGLPSPWPWLSDDATVIFNRLAQLIDSMGIGSIAYADMLSMASMRVEEIQICQVMIEDCGRTYETTNGNGGVMIRSRPEVAQKNEAMRHLQSLLSEFGLSAAALSKVSIGGKGSENPFEAL